MEPLAHDLNQGIYEEINFNNNKKAITLSRHSESVLLIDKI